MGDKKLGIFCGNLEEVANDYQISTSAGGVLERIEGWVHSTVKMAPLKVSWPLVIETRIRRYFLQTSHTKSYTYMYSGVWCSGKSTE